MFSGNQAFVFCTLILCMAIACTAVRLVSLPSRWNYWYFLGIFSLWEIATLTFFSVDPRSRTYFWSFCAVTCLLWLFYLLAAQALYRHVFSGYPGIASVGKWIVLAAGSCILITGAADYYLSRNALSPGWLYTTINRIDRSLLLGLAVFFGLLLSIMARYPISIPKNLVVHCVAFGSVLLIQAIISLIDQWTSHQITASLNNASSLISALAVFTWAWVLTSLGDVKIVRTRPNVNPTMEFQLLGQLESLNGMLLRAARK